MISVLLKGLTRYTCLSRGVLNFQHIKQKRLKYHFKFLLVMVYMTVSNNLNFLTNGFHNK